MRRAAYVATCLQTAQRRLMKALANAISEGGLIKVEHLYLHGNNISDEGIEVFSKSMGALNNLEDLTIYKNQIGEEGMKALALTLSTGGALRSTFVRSHAPSFLTPHYPPCGTSPCALLRGSGCWGELGWTGCTCPQRVFSPFSCVTGWPVYFSCRSGVLSSLKLFLLRGVLAPSSWARGGL